MSRINYVVTVNRPGSNDSGANVHLIPANRFVIENDSYIFYGSPGTHNPIASFKRSSVQDVLPEDLFIAIRGKHGVNLEQNSQVKEKQSEHSNSFNHNKIPLIRPTEKHKDILQSRATGIKSPRPLKESLISFLSSVTGENVFVVDCADFYMHYISDFKKGKTSYPRENRPFVTKKDIIIEVLPDTIIIGDCRSTEPIVDGRRFELDMCKGEELRFNEIQFNVSEIFNVVESFKIILEGQKNQKTFLFIEDMFFDNIDGVLKYVLNYCLFSIDENNQSKCDRQEVFIRYTSYSGKDSYGFHSTELTHKLIPVTKYELV